MQLDALFANAPAELIDHIDVDALSWVDAGALVRSLREAGVSPTPSEKQIAEIARLMGLLKLEDAAVAELLACELVSEQPMLLPASPLRPAMGHQAARNSPPAEEADLDSSGGFPLSPGQLAVAVGIAHDRLEDISETRPEILSFSTCCA